MLPRAQAAAAVAGRERAEEMTLTDHAADLRAFAATLEADLPRCAIMLRQAAERVEARLRQPALELDGDEEAEE